MLAGKVMEGKLINLSEILNDVSCENEEHRYRKPYNSNCFRMGFMAALSTAAANSHGCFHRIISVTKYGVCMIFITQDASYHNLVCL